MSVGEDGPASRVPLEPLRVRSHVREGCLVVEAGGEFTILTSDRLREYVLAGLRDLGGTPRVVMDVGEVDFCDSSGLNALIVLWKKTHRAGGALVLARPQRRFRVIIERSGLDRHFISYPSQQDAVAALTAPDEA